ncbi:isochorismate synthase [Pseudonocardia yuanmonensis]|uniref:Isochorismate synthase n=1 Tax=Pseudonocardia yuanmonensis TaxID=1095914 RepID=A0ABP8XSR8_9PSEU
MPTLGYVTTAALPTGLEVRTREVDPPADGLLSLLPQARGALSWVRGGEGLVGWGEVARFTGTGAGRFAEADAWWRRLLGEVDVADEVGLPGTGAVAFASLTFADRSPGSVLVVPRVVVGMRGGRAWVTEFGDPHPMTAAEPVRPSGRLRYADGDLPVAGYRAAVAEAVRRMRAGELGKAALAHDLLAVDDAPHDPRHLLRGLAERYPTCWAFAVDGLVGATPELLLRKRGPVVESRVLAGTVWPGEGSLSSEKNRVEHAYAVDSLAERLRPFCRTLEVPSEPTELALHNVSHLASDVRGRVRGDASLLRIAGAVHPTAAVGGTPRAEAVALIAALEGMDRGRYAGPVGWIGADGGGELGVALRCAQLDGPVARLYAGCGIVSDSDPDTEVREAAAKLLAVREALEG